MRRVVRMVGGVLGFLVVVAFVAVLHVGLERFYMSELAYGFYHSDVLWELSAADCVWSVVMGAVLVGVLWGGVGRAVDRKQERRGS